MILILMQGGLSIVQTLDLSVLVDGHIAAQSSPDNNTRLEFSCIALHLVAHSLALPLGRPGWHCLCPNSHRCQGPVGMRHTIRPLDVRLAMITSV